MVEIINASKEFSAPLDRVWDIISNMDDEPRYWQGLNAVYNVSNKGNVIEREVTGGLRDLKGRQTVVLYPKKSIGLTLTEGPMIGTRIITLIPSKSDNETITTRVNVSWDIKLSDNVPLLFRGIVRERIAEATEEVIDRIARAVQ
jgi:carbon monoxide dehydrogenase subunit G